VEEKTKLSRLTPDQLAEVARYVGKLYDAVDGLRTAFNGKTMVADRLEDLHRFATDARRSAVMIVGALEGMMGVFTSVPETAPAQHETNEETGNAQG